MPAPISLLSASSWYEMVTGRRPFAGESRASVTAAILSSDPPPMSALQPVTPPVLERVVNRCLAKNPDDRWQTARDLGWELKSIADEAAHAANVVRERKRGAMLVGALIGAGLVVAVSVAVDPRAGRHAAALVSATHVPARNHLLCPLRA